VSSQLAKSLTWLVGAMNVRLVRGLIRTTSAGSHSTTRNTELGVVTLGLSAASHRTQSGRVVGPTSHYA